MKKLTTIVLILLSSHSFAQDKILITQYINVKQPVKPGSNIKSWTTAVVLSNGDTIPALSFLALGKGSLPNGDYNYIAKRSNTMEAKLRRSNKLNAIWLERIKRKGHIKYGFKYEFEAEGNYLIQLEDAVASGEILLRNKQ